jgi:hypothetical protein
MVQRLIRMKALDPARLQGRFVSSEKWEICRTLTAAQVQSRTSVEAMGLGGRQVFSSHLWFFGSFPV